MDNIIIREAPAYYLDFGEMPELRLDGEEWHILLSAMAMRVEITKSQYQILPRSLQEKFVFLAPPSKEIDGTAGRATQAY